MKKSIKKIMALALALTMGLSLTACGGAKDGGDAKATAAPESKAADTTAAGGEAKAEEGSGEKVVINFFHRWPNDPKNSMFQELIQEYMAENPNVTINMDCILNDQYKEKIRMVVATDEVPDIFSSWSGTFAKEMIDSGNVMELNDIYDGDTEWSSKIFPSMALPSTERSMGFRGHRMARLSIIIRRYSQKTTWKCRRHGMNLSRRWTL